jgi:tRNA 2-thiouridine synthesizing protein E
MKTFQCNAEGYLLDELAWTPQFAEQVALVLQKTLTEFDWKVIAFVREFYAEHRLMPLTRVIVQQIKALDPHFNSIHLQAHYTDKPLWVLAKLAGLPKPVQCI